MENNYYYEKRIWCEHIHFVKRGEIYMLAYVGNSNQFGYITDIIRVDREINYCPICGKKRPEQ